MLIQGCSDREVADPNAPFGNAGSAGTSNAGASGGGSGSNGSSGAGGSTADPNQPAAPGVLPTFIPNFPGAGTSGDDAPLTNGELCDYVPANGAPTPEELTTCFFAPGGLVPAATMEQVLECVDGQDVVHIRLTFSPFFADNTYGENSVGWHTEEAAMDPMMDPMTDPMMMMGKPPKMPRGGGKGGHSFDDLVGSDHAEIVLTDENGDTVVQFKLDYISEDADASSGYSSLGVTGGEGEMIVGEADWILDWQTSFALNLNERGYDTYLTDSPATDENFSPNPDAPEWDYRVVYEAWIDVAAFGDVGFGTALIEFVHASPSKANSNTLEVEPGDCPQCQPDDPNCEGTTPPPCEEDTPEGVLCTPPSDGVCDNSVLDADCNDGGVGEPPPEESYCLVNPTDPACHVD